MFEQLVHNGIIVPDIELPKHLEIIVRGERMSLTPRQAEMAMAWAKKQGTPYVEDTVFARNFMRDFSAELGVSPPLKAEEVDISHPVAIVAAQRRAKEQLGKEERKALAVERKVKREALKEEYGHAIVNGERVELANYVAEPSSIFMGRGRHPLRGKWKEGPRQHDITLNLSPDAPRPPGEWAEIVWEPESFWVARWRDKLSGRLKYVWLHDSAPLKQEREAAKFDQAVALSENLEQVRERIQQDLDDLDTKRRMVATACYLIDVLCLRVGDEKDADEADTVGATTLRPEHIKLQDDGMAEFSFLGKDSVRWNKQITLPPTVRRNLEELIENARPSGSSANSQRRAAGNKPQIFPRIGSSDVNAYLSDIVPGLTAKVFRTHHATEAVRQSLAESGVVADDPDYKKWGAVGLANYEAAVLCNHSKQAPANWRERRQKAKEREERLKERLELRRTQYREAEDALKAVRQEAKEKRVAAKTSAQREKLKVRYDKRIERAKKKVATTRDRLDRAKAALDKARIKDTVTAKKRTWNLGTSLKSYIDPRAVYRWGQSVEYDVIDLYYPALLRRKFAWVREAEEEGEAEES